MPLESSPTAATRPERSLSAWSILRSSSKISGANLLGVVILFPVNILMARVLGPELWGLVGLVALWQLYASFTRPGIFNAAYREIPPLLARHQPDEARRIQNIGITGDSLYLVLPISVMLLVALFQHNSQLRYGLMVGAGVFVLTQARDMLTNLQWAHQRFSLVARLNILVTIVTATFMLSTVKWLGYLTPILSPGLGALTMILGIWWGAPSVDVRIQFNRTEMLRLLKIGIPMGLSTLFYWGFRMTDRTAVALWLSLTELGYFTFILQFINLAILLISDFCNVLQPTLWAAIGRTEDIKSLGPEIRRLSLLVLLATCVGVNCAQACFGALVYWFVPKFIPSIEVFEIVVFLLAVGTLGFVPNHLLNSSSLNKQNRVMVVWAVSLPINLALAFLMVKWGWGLSGIALSSVLAQGFSSGLLLTLAQRYIYNGAEAQTRFYGSVLLLLLLTLGVAVAFHFGPFVYGPGSRVLTSLLLRIDLFGGVWGTMGGLWYLYRGRGRSLLDPKTADLVLD